MENILIERINEYKQKRNMTSMNALREVVQEITLFALSKTNFFSLSAFCGGTSLRIAYQLPRASEDLDFSLLKKDSSFSFEPYFKVVKDTFGKYGIEVELNEKNSDNNVKSAFLKSNTVINELNILMLGDEHTPKVKIKLEVDCNPPEGADVEFKYSNFPSPFSYLIYDIPSLFAGKLHAILCRKWDKGRDFYDYLFYLRNNSEINYQFLKNLLVQTGHLNENNVLDKNILKDMLLNKFNSVDCEFLKTDCSRFLTDSSELDNWSKELFAELTKEYFSD